MRFELFIARRLKLGGSGSQTVAPNLTIAMVGIVLAIIVMILSITIVCGFKKEISNKIYNLDSHIKVTNSAVLVNGNNYSTVNADDIMPLLKQHSIADSLSVISLIAEKPAILKTDDNFKGIVFRGVDDNFDWEYYRENLVEGRVPATGDSADVNEVIISRKMASQLMLGVDDRILTYFIDDKVRVRKSHIVGIYSTDFDEYDDIYILGSIKIVQGVNGWDERTGTYIGINTRYINDVANQAYSIYNIIMRSVIAKDSPIMYSVTDTTYNNMAYFSWLELLDMNEIGRAHV